MSSCSNDTQSEVLLSATIGRHGAVSSVATTDTLYVGDSRLCSSGSEKKGDAKKR